MQPVRQIILDAPDAVAVPPELRHQSIEVIFWPLEETVKPTRSDNVINDIRALLAETDPIELDDFSLDLTGFHFDREEANAR